MENFLHLSPERILYRDEYFFIILDANPVSPGHMLVISNELRKDFFELTKEERVGLENTILKAKELISKQYTPDGYNIGMNCGTTAGQTVFHFHCHIIPRYTGDTPHPRGGVRHVIEGKGNY